MAWSVLGNEMQGVKELFFDGSRGFRVLGRFGILLLLSKQFFFFFLFLCYFFLSFFV